MFLLILAFAFLAYCLFLTRLAQAPENNRRRWGEALRALHTAKQGYRQERRNLRIARRERGTRARSGEWPDAMGAVEVQRTAVRNAIAQARSVGAELGRDLHQRKTSEHRSLVASISEHNSAMFKLPCKLFKHGVDAATLLWNCSIVHRLWPLAAALLLVAGDVAYYRHFDFNVLPYYKDAPVANLIIVAVLIVPVLLAFIVLSLSIYIVLLLILVLAGRGRTATL